LKFAFKLALALNWSSVEDGLNNISSKEFAYWEVYNTLDPFGEDREDYRAGIVASTVLNASRTNKKDKVWKPEEFIPKFGKEQKVNKQTVEQQLKIVEMLNIGLNGNDLRGK